MDNFEFTAEEPLSDDELVQLDAFLQSDSTPEETFWIDELDGFFAALICGPRVVSPNEWLPAVWNGESPEWSSEQEYQGIFALMMRHWNSIARGIDDGTYEPVMRYRTDDAGGEADDPAGWCYGFIEGAAMWGVDDWEDEELRSLITPMVALRDEGTDDEPDDDVADMVRRPGAREELIEMLPAAVEELRAYWAQRAVPPDADVYDDLDEPTTRPTTPRRNDPCPCGSGKKYKHCCGAPV